MNQEVIFVKFHLFIIVLTISLFCCLSVAMIASSNDCNTVCLMRKADPEKLDMHGI